MSGRTGRLSGRKAIITGAASGIGRATAELFVREGAEVALFDVNAAGVAAVGGALGAAHFAVDVVDEHAVAIAVRAAAAVLGGLDAVANVAGVSINLPVGQTTLHDWNRVLAVNLTGPFLICREALPFLACHERASIVNVASASGLLPVAKGLSAYAASKAGLITLSKAMASELAPKIRVNALCPGAVATPFLSERIRDVVNDPDNSPYALRRAADPAEIANAVLWLISDESSFVTGAALAIDGGRTFH